MRLPRIRVFASGGVRLNGRELRFGEARQLRSFELSVTFSRHWRLSKRKNLERSQILFPKRNRSGSSSVIGQPGPTKPTPRLRFSRSKTAAEEVGYTRLFPPSRIAQRNSDSL